MFSPEVQSILNLNPPQDAELLNANPSPPVSAASFSSDTCLLPCAFPPPHLPLLFPQPSPSQQINLGPSSNPSAKPNDFHFLKVIGKGSFGKVLLARHRADDQFYAVKVLQKKAILKKKEVKAPTCPQIRSACIKRKLLRHDLLFVFLRRNTSCLSGMCC